MCRIISQFWTTTCTATAALLSQALEKSGDESKKRPRTAWFSLLMCFTTRVSCLSNNQTILCVEICTYATKIHFSFNSNFLVLLRYLVPIQSFVKSPFKVSAAKSGDKYECSGLRLQVFLFPCFLAFAR